MKSAVSEALRALEKALFGIPTRHTNPALRASVAARAAAHGGAPGSGEIPPVLEDYVEKVARHAYDITDEDVAALRRGGYSEDAIFEITLAAATGAGLLRRARGLAAIGDD